jgi:large subunit ribosomal protein L25
VRILRREGNLPAVIYSKSVSPISLEISQREFYKTYKLTGKTNVIDLKIGEKQTLPCIVHALDVHPVRGEIRHVDFLAVNLKEKVTASVPVLFSGESKAVKELGGILSTSINQLEVEALPDEIPSEIVVDISTLEAFDDVIRVENLPTSTSYKVQNDSDLVIASITSQTVESAEISTSATEESGADQTSPENKK